MFIPNYKSLNKFPKRHKIKCKSLSVINNLVQYNVAIVSQSFTVVTYKQLECLRRFLSRRLVKRTKKLPRVCIFSALYKKSSKARMGKGKGKFVKWYGFVKKGQILFEFKQIFSTHHELKHIMRPLQSKLPFKVKIVSNTVLFKV